MLDGECDSASVHVHVNAILLTLPVLFNVISIQSGLLFALCFHSISFDRDSLFVQELITKSVT